MGLETLYEIRLDSYRLSLSSVTLASASSPLPPASFSAWISRVLEPEPGEQNIKLRTQNSELKTQKTQSLELRTKNSELKAQNLKT